MFYSTSRLWFFIRYYVSNFLYFRVGGLVSTSGMRKYKAFWSEFYERYKVHDTWLVVANGPSLNVTDLESLSKIPSIASNKINLLYSTTKWRPTLYTIADPLLLFKLAGSHYSSIPHALTSTNGFHMVRAKNKAPWKMQSFGRAVGNYSVGNRVPDPVESGFFGSKTITISNIQLAMWLGAKKIYLIGCDHDYDEESSENVVKLSHGGTSNHFHPDYRRKGEIVNNAPIRAMNEGFEHISRIANDHGIEIVNISRRTKLTTFKVASVESALQELLGSS